jgi:hypothetical protein
MADTVRSWIFSAAASETQQGSKKEQHIQVVDALRDPSGRSMNITEAEGKRWLLIRDQKSDTSIPGHNGEDDLMSCGTVVVRGEATKWSVPLYAAGLGSDIHVAAVWNVLPNG